MVILTVMLLGQSTLWNLEDGIKQRRILKVWPFKGLRLPPVINGLLGVDEPPDPGD